MKPYSILDKRLPPSQQIQDLRKGWKGEMILDVWSSHDRILELQADYAEWAQGLVKSGAEPEQVTQAAKALESLAKAASSVRGDLFRIFLHPRESTAKGEHRKAGGGLLLAEVVESEDVLKRVPNGHPEASSGHPSEGDSGTIPEADASV